ncbi:EamA family transporter RarD [Ottowia beijingensis]|jgi:chloramphenicol-sensitive protein RarD|uniref:EamA family transporter RarD n=1 Tax=Ottowia beijingensis TaxID=1207057 RepID=A0A853IX17_9BURK|nr:EamA family transporter RarD [Ottowia beijingensis]NZA01950.1 EamA family transporter RarD [Ottowia beijingensis]
MNSGVTAALLAYGLWGLMPLYFRLMAPATAIEVVAHRIVWSLALLLLWLGVLGQLGPLWRRLDARLLARLALAALLVSINWLTYVWAVTHGRTLDASLGYFLLPLFNVALGVLLLGERLTRGEWIGVMLAALGVGYLALVSPRLPWVALVLAASFGVYGLVKKQTELPAAEGMALETGLIALPALAVLGWLATRGQLAFGQAGAGTDALLISTGLMTTVPLVAFAVAARRLTLAALGMLQYISPTLQFLLGVFVLHEPVDAQRLAGFAAVWLGLLVFSAGAYRRHRTRLRHANAA